MTLKEGLEPKCSFSPAAKVGEGGCTLHCAPTEGPAQPLVWGVLPMVSHPPCPTSAPHFLPHTLPLTSPTPTSLSHLLPPMCHLLPPQGYLSLWAHGTSVTRLGTVTCPWRGVGSEAPVSGRGAHGCAQHHF